VPTGPKHLGEMTQSKKALIKACRRLLTLLFSSPVVLPPRAKPRIWTGEMQHVTAVLTDEEIKFSHLQLIPKQFPGRSQEQTPSEIHIKRPLDVGIWPGRLALEPFYPL
jgi:hypothetical protein